MNAVLTIIIVYLIGRLIAYSVIRWFNHTSETLGIDITLDPSLANYSFVFMLYVIIEAIVRRNDL
jgi:hypothetical protein